MSPAPLRSTVVLRRTGRALILFLLIAAAGATAAAPVAAQATARRADSTQSARRGDWMLSVNPLGLMMGGITGEAERRIGGTRTVAGAVNYWGAAGASYMSVDAKLRFYRARGSGTMTGTPDAQFEGLSFGPMIGFQRIAYDACALVGETCAATGITAGGTVDYGWRLGEEQAFAVVTGGGLKTGFGFGGLASGTGARITYPFLRLGVGYVLPKGR
jgi:hypothetical protein